MINCCHAYSTAGFDALSRRHSDVTIEGAGDVRVHASENLKAKIRGAGDVRYEGHPKNVEPSILGAGDISALD